MLSTVKSFCVMMHYCFVEIDLEKHLQDINATSGKSVESFIVFITESRKCFLVFRLYLSLFNGHLGEYSHSLSCQELHEKIDTTVMSVR